AFRRPVPCRGRSLDRPERSDPRAARGFCRGLRSDAGEKLLARGLRGRPRLVVFLLSLALPALIVGPTEPLAAHGSMRTPSGGPSGLSPEPAVSGNHVLKFRPGHPTLRVTDVM